MAGLKDRHRPSPSAAKRDPPSATISKAAPHANAAPPSDVTNIDEGESESDGDSDGDSDGAECQLHQPTPTFELLDDPKQGRKQDETKREDGQGDQEEGDQEEGDQEEGDQEEGDQEEGDQEEGDQEEGDQEEGDQEDGHQEEDGGEEDGHQEEDGGEEDGGEEDGGEEDGGRASGGPADPEKFTLFDVAEKYVVTYCKKTYGVPDSAVVFDGGEALKFATVEDMNAMLASKSPKEWVKVLRTSHMVVLHAEYVSRPRGGQVVDGKYNGDDVTDLPRETFLYIRAYVDPDPEDPQQVLRAEHDKQRLRHLTKAVAKGVQLHLVQRLKDMPKRRNSCRALTEWRPCRDPQVVPQVANWIQYAGLTLITAYKEGQSTPRKIGPNSKKLAAMGAKLPNKTEDAPKRKAVALNDDASRDHPSNSFAVHVTEDNDVGTNPNPNGIKRVRFVQVYEGSKTVVHVEPGTNRVAIIELR
jgi:hypothetical protein